MPVYIYDIFKIVWWWCVTAQNSKRRRGSRDVILTLGVRGPGFKSQVSSIFFSVHNQRPVQPFRCLASSNKNKLLKTVSKLIGIPTPKWFDCVTSSASCKAFSIKHDPDHPVTNICEALGWKPVYIGFVFYSFSTYTNTIERMNQRINIFNNLSAVYTCAQKACFSFVSATIQALNK